jgi:hypothetical protein
MREKIEKLSEKKQQILQAQKLLIRQEREKEKRIRIKKSIEIGKLACKANIDLIDSQALLGAFLELAHRASEAKNIEKWQQAAKDFLHKSQFEQQTLCVSFQSEPSSEVKKRIQDLGFRWNKFRKEFYGYGKKIDIENMFKDLPCKIEILS